MKKVSMSDSDKVQVLMTASLAGAAGWNTKHLNPGITRGQMIFLYLLDQRTQTTFAAGVSREFFKNITGHIQRYPSLHEAAQRTAGVAIMQYLKTERSKLSDEEEQALTSTLAGSLAAYAGITRSLKLADNLASGGHFIVLHYQKKGEDTGLMRPVISPAQPDSILPVEALQSYVSAAMAHDKKNNPHWF